jgi:hypothetical protein
VGSAGLEMDGTAGEESGAALRVTFDPRVLREKVVKIGAKVIAHARYTVFQMAEVAVPRELFRRILGLIDELRPRQVARC